MSQSIHASTPPSSADPDPACCQAMPANLSSSLDAKRRQIPSWSSARMLTQKDPAASMRGHVLELRPAKKATTGLKDMDRMLGGMHSSDLIILAGRPSMGKTALVTNMAFNAAKKYFETDGAEGAPVAFLCLEMAAEQLATRILSEPTRVQTGRSTIREGRCQYV